jgi:hypothetical protein
VNILHLRLNGRSEPPVGGDFRYAVDYRVFWLQRGMVTKSAGLLVGRLQVAATAAAFGEDKLKAASKRI